MRTPDELKGLYLHIPFCASRCTYCDFHTSALLRSDPVIPAYVEALTLAIKRLSRADLLGSLQTIYIGGGTPSFIGSHLVTLCYNMSLLVSLSSVSEFSVEANPESFTEALCKDLWALGVNRFSFGVQSFQEAELKAVGRIHTAQKAKSALKIAQSRGAQCSVDLICGLPYQTLSSFYDSVYQAIELGVDHVSIYPLMVEEGTALFHQIASGDVSVPDEDFQAEALLSVQELLNQAGLYRYEVASYARPGAESQHNLSYWSGIPYLGLGSSASSMLSPDLYRMIEDILSLEPIEGATSLEQGDKTASPLTQQSLPPDRIRCTITDSASQFAQFTRGKHLSVEREELTRDEAACEDIMLGFRTTRGFDELQLERLVQSCAPEVACSLRHELLSLEELGLIAHENGRFVPTDQGWLKGNELFMRLWDCSKWR